MKHLAIRALLSVVLVVCVTTRIQAGTIFTELVVFGDSLTDTGNLFAATATPPPPLPAPFPPDPPYFDGNFSNGPNWVEQMASLLGLPVPAPSLRGGTNYAWGGAETSTTGVSARLTPNLGAQISGLPGIPGFLTANVPTADQLFVMWGGANDFNNAAPSSNPAPASVAANVAANITTLANAGAKHFLIPNLPRLGEIPRHKGTADEAIFNQLSIDYNAALAVQLDALESLHGISILRLDVFSIVEAILDNPAIFGFTNTTGTAKVVGDTTNTANFFDPRVVSNPDEYVFFDDVHPTRATHALLGTQAAQLVGIPEPASFTIWFLLAASFATVASRQRLAAGQVTG